jgi:hypothetical protein
MAQEPAPIVPPILLVMVSMLPPLMTPPLLLVMGTDAAIVADAVANPV